MRTKKFKVVKISITEYLMAASVYVIIILLAIMLTIFYHNTMLEVKTNMMNDYLEEYQILKEEIDTLIEIKENYEIIIKNNEELESKTTELESKISELNNQISKLNKKIDKFK